MKYRLFLTVTLLLAAVAYPALAGAIAFSDMPQWNTTQRYHVGDVVARKYDMYVALIPSYAENPENSPRWKRVAYQKVHEFNSQRLYLPSQVVKHADKYYLARRLSVVLRDDVLHDENRWLEFTHPGLVYNLPDPNLPPDTGSLLGADSNKNGIRDDYEVAIVYSHLPSPVVGAALNAGKAYGQLMQTAAMTTIEPAVAKSVLEGLVLAKQCKRQLARNVGGNAWQEATYFNSFERIEAKYALQNMLAKSIDPTTLSTSANSDACTALSTR